MSEHKKLFLIDSYALIFRAYYAFINNPMRNAKGMNTSTVFGFTLALDEIIKKESPTHILAAFDVSGPTFRHELFQAYKANRDATPEEIKESVPYVKQLLESYRIPIVEKPGYEADDVIGTIAKKAEKNGYEVFMVTPDKDFAQLVSKRIQMYKPGRSGNQAEKWGVTEVCEKFGVENPQQVIDILALWGDSSDNIPGAPGIGEKNAKKLISKYGSVENLYDNIDDLKGKQKENLMQSREQVYLSKKLATILIDVPVEYDLELSRQKGRDKKMIESLFDELDFKNLKHRVLGESTVSNTLKTNAQGSLFESNIQQEYSTGKQFKTISSTSHDYALVEPGDELYQLIETLKGLHKFCFDTETTGLDIIDSQIVGVSFSWEKHKAVYVDFSQKNASFDDWKNEFSSLFDAEGKMIIGQNLKYDLHILKNYGITTKASLFDTMVAHYLLYPERKHGIDAIAEDLLGYKKIHTEDLIGKKGKNQRSFSEVEQEKVKEYACEDADITWQVYELLSEQLAKGNMAKLANDIEMPLVNVLMEMEHQGVYIDRDILSDVAGDLRKELIKTEKRIFDLAGREFNVSSPKQLGEILFDKLKIIPDAKKTKSKQYSTSEDVLTSLVDKHEIVRQVLDFRSSKKLLSTYLDALPKLIHPKTERVHTSFNQTLVTTGRLSSNNPNLQNIPIREERGREIRRAFARSTEENCFLSADYSQIELRLMAHLSGDNNMISAFMNNEDIHTATASKVYNVAAVDVTREMRSKAKTANFGIIYGISAFGLAQRMRIPRSEAKQLIDGYFETYPDVRKYMDECIAQARENGFVETMFGRRRNLPDIHSRNSLIRGNAERNAINTPIQGTAADIIKIAMVKIFEEFKKEKLSSKMIIQVHDELNFELPLNEKETVSRIVRKAMENAVDLSVPLVVDMNTGNNWLEAH
ncbi:MAG: DNA polymerase I [Bacteroidales bacterium]|nr:DNA polymerase I [Bacteroidales bacterium]